MNYCLGDLLHFKPLIFIKWYIFYIMNNETHEYLVLYYGFSCEDMEAVKENIIILTIWLLPSGHSEDLKYHFLGKGKDML